MLMPQSFIWKSIIFFGSIQFLGILVNNVQKVFQIKWFLALIAFSVWHSWESRRQWSLECEVGLGRTPLRLGVSCFRFLLSSNFSFSNSFASFALPSWLVKWAIPKFTSRIVAVEFFSLIWVLVFSSTVCVIIVKFGSSRLQVRQLRWVESDYSWHFLDWGNTVRPKSQSKIEMVEVEAKKPDEIVDVENRFGAKLAPQLVVDEQQQDVKHCENVPPKGRCTSHLNNY